MRNATVLIGLLLGLTNSGLAASTNLFSVPFILVTPGKTNFGVVPIGKTVTNNFVVENIGRGKLVGSATVAAPFKIISGGEYALKYGAAQIVSITYSPSGAATDEQTVKFTGGYGAKATVIGKPAPSRPGARP